MNLENFVAIALFSAAAAVTPGPNNTFLLASGMKFGLAKSLPYLFGIGAGLAGMMVAIGAGLGALLLAFPVIYQTLKFVGFAYLLYLAYTIVRSRGVSDSEAEKPATLWQSTLFQFVNPKAWIATTTVMATYFPVSAGWLANSISALIYIVLSCSGAVLWALFGTGLRNFLKDNRKRKTFNWLMAVLLVASMVPVLFL
jgi:threonine/homoserine/homoserine lactone efflux protein